MTGAGPAAAAHARTYGRSMLTLVLFMAIVAAVGVLAVRFGADSRPGFDERLRSGGPV